MKTITGNWVTPIGAAVVPVTGSLSLVMTLSANAAVSTGTGSGQIVPSAVSIPLTAGAIGTGVQVWANDELAPASTYYICKVVDSSNNILWSAGLTVSGATPINLNTLTPF